MVLNPNENYREVEKPAKSFPKPSPTEPLDEPAEKRERRDEREGQRRREVYEKYRNPQKETETERIPVRVSRRLTAAGRKRSERRGEKNRRVEVCHGRGKKREKKKTETGVDGSGRE